MKRGDEPLEAARQEALGMRSVVLRHYLLPSLLIALAGFATALWFMARIGDDLARAQIFYYQFVTHELAGGALTMVLLLGAWAMAGRVNAHLVEQVLRALATHPMVVGATSAVLLALASVFVYHGHPLSMDEHVVVFQSKIFAAGKLYGEIPVPLVTRIVPHFFAEEFFVVSATSGRVVQAYWPGFALLLTPFTLLGAPWLLNPLLAGGSLVVLSYVARRLWPSEPLAGGWAILLALASPAFTLNAISYYTMNAHLFFNLLYVALLLELSVQRLLWAGVVGSLSLTIQLPVPHAFFALPWLAYVAIRPRGARNLAVLAAGYLPLSLLFGVGWLLVRMMVRDAQLDEPSASDLVVQSFALLTQKFDLPRLDILGVRAMGWLKLFLWAAPGLPVVAWLGYFALRGRPPLRALGWSALSVLVGYLFVPLSQGHGWGFRFFHYAWFALPLLAAGFLVTRRGDRDAWTRAVGLAACLSLVAGTTVRFQEASRFIASHLAQAPKLDEGKRRITFLAIQDGYYVQDLVQNDPFLRGSEIRLLSHGKVRDAALMARLYPNARKAVEWGSSSVWVIE